MEAMDPAAPERAVSVAIEAVPTVESVSREARDCTACRRLGDIGKSPRACGVRPPMRLREAAAARRSGKEGSE